MLLLQVDTEIDKAESMCIATAIPSKFGHSFACTICKKYFYDYANMCRHRCLAHQRGKSNVRSLGPRSLSKRSPKDVNEDSNSRVLENDPYYSFFQNVSKNIEDNLSTCLDGTQDRITNSAKKYIKWKADKETVEKDSTKKSQVALTKYNFPQGYKLRPPQQMIKVIEKSVDEPQSFKTVTESNDPAEKLADEAGDENGSKQRYRTRNRTRAKKVEEKVRSSPAKTTQEETVAKDSGKDDSSKKSSSIISQEPVLRMCKDCNKFFHGFEEYRLHMDEKHKKTVTEGVSA